MDTFFHYFPLFRAKAPYCAMHSCNSGLCFVQSADVGSESRDALSNRARSNSADLYSVLTARRLDSKSADVPSNSTPSYANCRRIYLGAKRVTFYARVRSFARFYALRPRRKNVGRYTR